MATDNRTCSELLSEIETLRLRLEEAEDTLQAIHGGEVDALVISRPEGEQVFTLQGGHWRRAARAARQRKSGDDRPENNGQPKTWPKEWHFVGIIPAMSDKQGANKL